MMRLLKSVALATAVAALPVARLEIPRDASDCASLLTVASGAVEDVPWAISGEAGLGELPAGPREALRVPAFEGDERRPA